MPLPSVQQPELHSTILTSVKPLQDKYSTLGRDLLKFKGHSESNFGLKF